MNANSLPVAEFLPATPGTVPASPGAALADLPNAADLRATVASRGAATFAALLQSAGFAADALAAEESVETQRAEPEPPEGATEAAAPSSALEGLLFLAHVQATPATPGTTAQANATPPFAETASDSAARLAALASQRVVESSGMPLVLRAGVTEPALAGAFATVPPVGRPFSDGVGRPAREALPFDSDPLAGASFESAGEPAAPRSDPLSTFVLLEAAKRPAVEALAAETKPVAAPLPDPAASMTASANGPLSTLTAVVVDIDTPVTDPAWRGEIAGRMANLVTRGFEHAELRLSPVELGPVEVRIDMRGGEATLAIVATQATTRDALEQALPLLRDMLAQQGLSLGEATVHDGRGDDQAKGGEHAATPAGNAARPEAIDAGELSAPRPGLIRRLVDVFA
jgi:flagellar hook-length control protein FliK